VAHDLHASWAVSELAFLFNRNQDSITNGLGTPGDWSFYTSREGKRKWPLVDGVIIAENRTARPLKIAVEYKMPNEGLHGVLTALGQSLAYLEKGYNASVIVIPKEYDSHRMPGDHLDRVLQWTAPTMPISVYTYSEPDSSVTPFRNKLNCVRNFTLTESLEQSDVADSYIKTLWAHLREGSSDPDAFFKYCQTAKRLKSSDKDYHFPVLPPGLSSAVKRLSPGTDAYKYLSYSIGDSFLDMTWKVFWFTYIVNDSTIPLYHNINGKYFLNGNSSNILRSDGSGFKQFFVGRSDSVKDRAVKGLKEGTLSKAKAWELYATNIRNRAHSYREDIDSGLAGIGFITDDGRLTDLGYRFVDSCERTGNANNGISREIFASSVLQNGQLGAFLYYIYKLSEQKFQNNPLAFTTKIADGSYVFDQNEYRAWLEDCFQNELYIIRKVSARGGTARQPFQAEFAILRNLGYIKGFRIGVGLEINWPKVQESMNYFQSLT